MKKDILNEIRRFNDIINYNPKVGIINEMCGDKDLSGWLCIGEIDDCSVFFRQPENKLYIMVNPNYNGQEFNMSEYVRYCTTNDGTGAQTDDVPRYYLNGSGFKIYPEYIDTKYAEIFLGKRKDDSVAQKMHQDFLSGLYIDGDEVILHHNSSYKVTDGYVRKGEPNRWSNNSDIGIYFWASKNSGRDPSGHGKYTYFCRIPLIDLYDQETNTERTSVRQSMHHHGYVGQKWNYDNAIVVTTYRSTPIWCIRDNSTGQFFNSNWEEIECPLP